MWIERKNDIIRSPSLPVLAVLGLRQVGKSAFLERSAASARRVVTLDDPAERNTALSDPELFLRQHPFPLVIDECQLAPPLFRSLKKAVDVWRKTSDGKSAAVWLSGSNQVLVDHGIQESLAGRVHIRQLHPLSLAELAAAGISLTPTCLFLKGGWPELHANPQLPLRPYLNDYIRTAVEKDVSLFQGISQLEKFSLVLRLLAGRTGTLLNVSEVARDAAASPPTVASWIDGLARLGFVSKCLPFHSNTSKRLIKSPKLYFADVSLASRLSGWAEAEPLLVSPQAGALLENIVFQEIIRHSDNHDLGWNVTFFRTRDGEEIDFVVEGSNHSRVALEVKLGGGDPLRAKLGDQAKALLGDIPLVLVGLTTETRAWRGQVHTAAIHEIGATLERLLARSLTA